VSKLPAEDCCTLFASRLADTRAAPERLSTLEARLDLAETVAELVASAELVRPRPGRPLPAENSAAPEPILQSTYTGDIQS
jgi:hypothetical protein